MGSDASSKALACAPSLSCCSLRSRARPRVACVQGWHPTTAKVLLRRSSASNRRWGREGRLEPVLPRKSEIDPETQRLAERLRSHVSVLASDDVEGRGVGSAGASRARAYLKRELERCLAPAGTRDEVVTAREGDAATDPVQEERFFLRAREPARWENEHVSLAKVVVEEPTPGRAVREIRSSSLRLPLLMDFDREHAGLLRTVDDWRPGAPSAVWLADTSEVSTFSSRRADGERGKPVAILVGPRTSDAEIGQLARVGVPLVVIHDDSTVLVARAARRGDQRFRLNFDVEAAQAQGLGEIGTNLTLRLEGTANLDDGAVYVTSHLDHLGVRPHDASQRGDAAIQDVIFNGANDDASGVAASLEMACGLARRPVERDAVFVWFDAEERGRLGSIAYAERHALSAKDAVADFNLEMLGRPDGFVNEVWVTGSSFSTLADVVTAAMAQHRVQLVDAGTVKKQFGLLVMYADSFTLLQRGIPAHSFSVGRMKPPYHKVDDHADTLDYTNLARVTQALEAAVRTVAVDEVSVRLTDEGRGYFDPSFAK